MDKIMFSIQNGLKRTALFSILALATILSNAVNNRFGMNLSGTAGNYTLTDESKICPLIVGGCASLPLDAFQAYSNKSIIITESDYAFCTTKQYTFKTYQNYALTLEVDIPLLTSGPYPFIIYVHGGGWTSGNSAAFENQSRYMASRGIAGVRIEYSLVSDGGTFNLGVQELVDALSFLKTHSTELQLDFDRFGYAGGSAGTPLASLAAMKQNGNGCKLFIGCNGIYDFEHNLNGSFGKSSNYLTEYPTTSSRRAISAINFIPTDNTKIPAVAVFHGSADFTISDQQSIAFCDSILKKGGRAEVNSYINYVHGFFNQGSSDMFEDVTLKMYAFAKSVFKTPDILNSANLQITDNNRNIIVNKNCVVIKGLENATATLFNFSGAKIRTINKIDSLEKITVNKKGNYILSVTNGKSIIVKKIVIK